MSWIAITTAVDADGRSSLLPNTDVVDSHTQKEDGDMFAKEI